MSRGRPAWGGPDKVRTAPADMAALRDVAARLADAPRRPARPPERVELDPDRVEQGLARLVLGLIETLRQLLERQAVRRVDSGRLSEEEVERLGQTLLKLEERMGELKQAFGLQDEDLGLPLGPLNDLLE